MSLFSAVEMAPRDPILGLNEQFAADTNPNKVNLGVGVYYDDAGKLPLLKCVQAAEAQIMGTPKARGYLPIDGIAAYDGAVKGLVFGSDSDVVTSDRVATIQAIGGTGGLKVGADFLRRMGASKQVLISDPSWENHRALFVAAGFDVDTYPYYDAANRGINFDGMLARLQTAAPGTIVVLHACCHNPTGANPSPELWAKVADVLSLRGAIPFVDLAYQGFGDGLEADALATRLIAARFPEVLIAASCSKNFGIYRERTGVLIALSEPSRKAVVQANLAYLNRQNFSFPPDHGARLVTMILEDPALCADWQAELEEVRLNMLTLRQSLAEELRRATNSDRYDFVAHHRGMFSRLGITQAQVDQLRDTHGIYMVGDSRINIAGLNARTVPILAQAIAAVGG